MFPDPKKNNLKHKKLSLLIIKTVVKITLGSGAWVKDWYYFSTSILAVFLEELDLYYEERSCINIHT